MKERVSKREVWKGKIQILFVFHTYLVSGSSRVVKFLLSVKRHGFNIDLYFIGYVTMG
jgi:hypothetical protein